MRAEKLEHPSICYCCERNVAVVANGLGMPLCPPCWSLLWVKEELSQPPKPGDEQWRASFRLIEECLIEGLRAEAECG